MKIIKVGKECRIINEDIARHRNRLTAISVVALDDTDGFINMQLSIDDFSQCGEVYDAVLVKNTDMETVFVDKIEIYEETDEKHDKIPAPDDFETEYGKLLDLNNLSVVAVVKGMNDDVLAYGYVYNIHDGYYYHEVFVDENGKNIYKSEI